MKEIQRISVADAVVDRIREMIDSGQYAPGQKLPTESELCAMMKVSRTSVREAFSVLKALGFVELRPGKGAFVADYLAKHVERSWYDVDDAKFYDFMEVRLAIETLSVRLSVERANEEQIHELEEIHTAFVSATLNQDLVRMIMLDELFHRRIAEFTNNQLLINISDQLLECFRVYRSDSFTNKHVYQNAIGPHAAILDCYKKRDSQRAVQEMTAHLDITAKDMEIIHCKTGDNAGSISGGNNG